MEWRHGDKETRRQKDMETRRHGDMETRRHGDTETWRYGFMETWRHGHGNIKRKTETEAQAIFLNPFTNFVHHGNGSLSFFRLLTKKQTEAIRKQID
jgi:hypothetical protein